MSGHGFSLARLMAVLVKEFIQMRRDRLTFAMMIGIPVMQLLMFGYAINFDPRDLPILVELHDQGPVSRAVIAGMDSSGYFRFIGTVETRQEAEEALRSGAAKFVLVIPKDFERDVVRGEHPTLLLDADASDPSAAGGAIGALNGIVAVAARQVLTGPLAPLAARPSAFDTIVHRHYNPEGLTSLNIVPGLLAVILSMTMVMITSIAIVRESEKGTMEMLIATPVRPLEVMLGKIAPYVGVAYVQTTVFLVASRLLFAVPFEGNGPAFFLAFNIYIVVNLALGFLFSTIARSQMQAMQMSFFYMLPSILLSGFAFPFEGMPGWAQMIGNAIPATHFLRISREIMLKGAGLGDIAPDMGALLVIMAVVTGIALKRYRQTLD